MLCIRAVKGDAVDGVCPEEEEGGGGDGWTVTPAARVDGVSGRDEELITLPPLADDPCSPFASDLWNWMTFASACAMAASEGVWLSCNDECALVEIRGAVSAVQVTGWGLAVVMTGRREAVEIGWRIGTAGERGLAVTGCGAVERGRRIVGAMAVGGWEVTVDGEEIVLLASLELSSSESESRQITSTLSPPPPVGPVFPLQLPILAWLLLLPAPPLLASKYKSNRWWWQQVHHQLQVRQVASPLWQVQQQVHHQQQVHESNKFTKYSRLVLAALVVIVEVLVAAAAMQVLAAGVETLALLVVVVTRLRLFVLIQILTMRAQERLAARFPHRLLWLLILPLPSLPQFYDPLSTALIRILSQPKPTQFTSCCHLSKTGNILFLLLLVFLSSQLPVFHA